jgi:hypothetical protein
VVGDEALGESGEDLLGFDEALVDQADYSCAGYSSFSSI